MLRKPTRPVSDFLPRILAHIDGVDVDMVSAFIMDAVIQFLRDTKVLTELVCVELEHCTISYLLPTHDRISEVMSVRFFQDGRQIKPNRYQYRIHDGVFYIDNPTDNTRAEVELAVAPRRDSGEVPEFIYEEWADAITAQTLMRLYLLTDNEWHNPQAANNQSTLYQQLVRQARFSKVTKHKPFNMRLANMRRA